MTESGGRQETSSHDWNETSTVRFSSEPMAASASMSSGTYAMARPSYTWNSTGEPVNETDTAWGSGHCTGPVVTPAPVTAISVGIGTKSPISGGTIGSFRLLCQPSA